MTLDDFDRPLNKRGKSDAPFMAQKLNYKNIHPDIIISSPAKRAKSTAKAFKDILEFKDKIKFDDSLYDADLCDIEKVIKNIDDRYTTSFVFSHNPAINEFAQKHLNIDENIPTCGITGVEFRCKEWKDALKSAKKLLLFDYPKNYKVDENEN